MSQDGKENTPSYFCFPPKHYSKGMQKHGGPGQGGKRTRIKKLESGKLMDHGSQPGGHKTTSKSTSQADGRKN